MRCDILCAAGGTEAVVAASNPGIITHNIWGNDLVGQVNRNVSTLNRYYYLKDHLGSIHVTVNSSGTVVGHDDYDPWGMILEGRSLVSTADARYRFTSQERDAETGNHWFVTRHYDGRIGRFFSVDAHADLYPSISPFAYVGNNPVAFIDPTGMDSSYYNDKGQYAYVDDAGNNKLYESEQAAQLDWAQQMLGRWGEGDFYEETSIKGKFHKRFVEAVNEWASVQDLLAIMEGEAGSVARLLNAQFDVHSRAAKYGEPVLPFIGAITAAVEKVGLQYGTHSLLRLSGRESHVTAKMIATALRKGEKFFDPKNNAVNYILRGGFASGQDLLVGVGAGTGRITTILTGRGLVRGRMVQLPK